MGAFISGIPQQDTSAILVKLVCDLEDGTRVLDWEADLDFIPSGFHQ